MPGPLSSLARRFLAAVTPTSLRARRLRREFAAGSGADDAARALYAQFIREGSLVFDVGANVGRRTHIFRRLGARVIAVEPQPRCVEVLRALFREDPAVTILPEALGAAPGEAELLVADVDTLSTMDHSFAEAVQASGRFAGHRWQRRIRVPVTTLDAVIERFGTPDFVKIDVEGFELEVLRGLTRPLPAVSLEWVPELTDRGLACVRRLAELGAVETNVSLGESMTLEWSEWRKVEALPALLAPLASRVDLFGDLYVRSVA